MNMDNESSLRTAVRAALVGEAMLFLGAGAAKDAQKDDGETLPTGQELADLLANDCDLPPGYSLDTIAEHFIDKYSETKLINILRKYLKVSNIGETLSLLGSIKWLRVWTTNYDDAFEKALDENKQQYYSLTTSADVHNARGNKLIVLHINGALLSLRQSITSDFILTSQSYATQSFVETEWSTIFRNDIQQSKAIIFIGYSLADIDVARLVFNPATFHRKVHFIDRTNIDPVLKSKLSKFGTVHPIGLDKFFEILSDEKAQWIEPNFVEEYQCWKRIVIEDDSRTPSDDDFYDLILQGITKDGLLLNQLESPKEPTYTVVRNCEEACIKHLGQKDTVAMLVGSFCNGKTITASSIALKLVAGGRDVFILDHPYESAYTELQKLCRRDSDFILVIENYSRNLDLVECFCRYARPDCGLLLTERTGVHELRATALEERINKRDIRVYELDILENDEIVRLSSLLDLRGLWGERVGLLEPQRLAFLKEDCGRQLQAVLIEVIKSPQVALKLSNIVSRFESIEGGLRILIGFCLLQVIGEQPRTDVISELLGLSFDTFARLRKDDTLRQIVDVQSGVANFRSSVMARAVLNGLNQASVITEVVAECVKRGHQARHADPYLDTISVELMRFANLERILPEGKGKRPALQNLYEDLASISTIRENPYFWLQYAMARLSLGDLGIARRYFTLSHEYAKKIKGFDTFQIDNHYCRLLLREAEDATDADEAFKAVDEALTTLKKQVLRENRHYPYRSAWNLEGVAKRHGSKWTDEQRKAVIGASRYLVDAAQRLKPDVARSVAVVGGLQRLKVVIDVLSV
jgi:hypothetical protein